jgi:tripartite-type tricarboxylate transporter receptor subunit TctC
VINALVYKKLPYDVVNDFLPVTQIGESGGYFVLVAPTLGVNTITELVALAKAKPLSYGSPPAGNTLHLATEMFKQRTGAPLLHVPFKGGGEVFNSLIGGEIHVAFVPPPGAMPFVKAGRLKAIAFTGAARLPAATEVPTLGESGVTDMVVDFTWHGWFLPAKTPHTIARRLRTEARNALQTPKMKTLMDAVSFQPVASSPEDFRRYLLSEMKRYAEIVKATGVRVE